MNIIIFNKLTDQIYNINTNNYQDLLEQIEKLCNISKFIVDISINNKTLTRENYNKLQENDILLIGYKSEEQISEAYETYQTNIIDNSLLHVKCRYKNHRFLSFIDTGAQVNIMSNYIAKLLNLEDKIDTNYQGVAKGVGSANVLGIINNVPIIINDSVSINVNFRIMEANNDDTFSKNVVLFGLDFILQHCSNINFSDRFITIKSNKIRFLNEEQIKLYSEPVNIIEENLKKTLSLLLDAIPCHKKKYTIDLLRKITDNILSNPNDDKYKSIGVNSKVLEDNIGKYYDSEYVMSSLGFTKCNDKYIYNKPIEYIKDISSIIHVYYSYQKN